MLKLTSSFYSFITVTCKRLDYKKAHVRKHTGLSSGQEANRHFCSARLLRQRNRKFRIKIPPLNNQEFDQTEQMSESLQPAVNHASYNGQFKVSTENKSAQAARGAHPSNPSSCHQYRCWETMNSSTDSGFTLKFKIVSYNVLAQYLLECHPNLYTGCSSHDLRWDVRAARLYHEIAGLDPDIICLQEVQASHIQEPPYSTFKDRGYACVYKQKTGSRNDGCAIFYKKSLLTLQDHVHVEFNQPELPILNRDNIGLIVKLVPTDGGGSPFVVATTHLLYNPRRTDVRLAQMQVLLAEIDRFAYFNNKQTSGHLPIVLTGDFNSKPESAVVKLLDDGYVSAFEYQDNSDWEQIGIMNNCQHLSVFLNRQHGVGTDFSKTKLFNSEYKNQPSASASTANRTQMSGYFQRDQIEYKLNLVSAYDRYKKDGSPEASSYQDRWVTVDYMYFSRNLRMISRLRLPTAEECMALYPMPNEVCPSDHLLLAASFELISQDHPVVCTL